MENLYENYVSHFIEKPSGQFLILIVMSHWLVEVWIRIQDILVVLLLSLFCLKNHVCLSRGVQVAGAAWRAVTRIMAGVGDLVQRTEDDRTGWVLGGRAIGRSGDAVCGLHHARCDEEHEFLGWASKTRSTVCEWFGLKTTRTVSRFGPQKRQLWFGDLCLKITVTVCFFGPQNQTDFGFSVAPQNRQREDSVGHVLRSGGLLHLEISRARVF
jgi:hypothetical protein